MIDMTDEYNTDLRGPQEDAFQEWLAQSGRQKDLRDYDLRGWWANNVALAGLSSDPIIQRDFMQAPNSMQSISRSVNPDAFVSGIMSEEPSTNIEDRRAQRGHLTDQFKKPNHPTFSDESIYHGVAGNEGGTWLPANMTGAPEERGDVYATGNREAVNLGKTGEGPPGPPDKWVFIPGKTNLEHFGTQGLQKYFNQFEPGNTVMLPEEEGEVAGAPDEKEGTEWPSRPPGP